MQSRNNTSTQFNLPSLLLFSIPIFILAFSTLLPTFRSTPLLRLRQVFAQLSPSFFTTTDRAISTMSQSYAKELHTALLAVQRASILTKEVYTSTAKEASQLSKDDHSPVTIGDFGAQALIIAAIRSSFPDDEIVGEEDADALRAEDGKSLKDKVWSYVQNLKSDDGSQGEEIGGPITSADKMLDFLDEGRSKGGNKGRIWALDPIDGTKGFLRGGQYAVCLALMVDGDVKVGVLGCPNLPVDDSATIDGSLGANQTGNESGRGVLISAVQGQGSQSRALLSSTSKLAEPHTINMKPITASDLSQATFCESFESGHSNHSEQAQIAQKLGITKPSVRMDSQSKYASIARGAGDIYLRLPVKKTYEEKIWDHAAGDLVVREAGGEVTDVKGNRLDFGIGRTLKNNVGVVAAPKGIHPDVLKVVQEILGDKAKTPAES